MEFAVNILALIMVLGLCWGAMMWLGGRFHGHGGNHLEADGYADFSQPTRSGEPCVSCEGVGAQHSSGRLAPCPACLGTGTAA